MAAMAAIFLNACSKNTYLPEAHTYANGIKEHMIAAGVCNTASCPEYIKLDAFGIKYRKVEYGKVGIDVLGVNSKELADRIIDSCKKTKTKLKSPEVVLKLYNTKNITQGTAPIMTATCD